MSVDASGSGGAGGTGDTRDTGGAKGEAATGFPQGWSGVPEILSEVERVLREVWDPELGLDVVSLGLVYGVTAEEGRVKVDMTLTTPGCPVADSLPAEVEFALRMAFPHWDVEIELVWDPPWTPERMELGAREALGL